LPVGLLEASASFLSLVTGTSEFSSYRERTQNGSAGRNPALVQVPCQKRKLLLHFIRMVRLSIGLV